MSNNDDLLQKITNLLIASVEDRKMMMASMQKLLEESESRIAKTNDMVTQLVSVCDRLTKCYEEHIDSLSRNMGASMEENSRLMQMLSSSQQELIKNGNRVDALINSIVEMSNASYKYE